MNKAKEIMDLIIDLTFDKHCKVKEVDYQQDKLVCDNLNELKEELKKNMKMQLCSIESNQKNIDELNKSIVENHLRKENELLNEIIELAFYKRVIEKLQIGLEKMIKENQKLFEESNKTEWDINHYDSCIGQTRNIISFLNKLLKENLKDEILDKLKPYKE